VVIALARDSIALGLAAQEYGSRFFANDASPQSGWIEYPGTFKDDAAKKVFRESWQKVLGGEAALLRVDLVNLLGAIGEALRSLAATVGL